jgi:hypothetical protein
MSSSFLFHLFLLSSVSSVLATFSFHRSNMAAGSPAKITLSAGSREDKKAALPERSYINPGVPPDRTNCHIVISKPITAS